MQQYYGSKSVQTRRERRHVNKAVAKHRIYSFGPPKTTRSKYLKTNNGSGSNAESVIT